MYKHVIAGLLIVFAGATFGQEPTTRLVNPLEGSAYDATTTLSDQTDVAVTIYNNDLGLVRDRRSIKLLPGEQTLTFMDVAAQIRPETVSLKSLTEPGALQILEQNYEFDLISPSKLMEKYVGKQVRLINKSTDVNFEEVTAELLSVNESPIYQVGNEIYLGHPGTVVLPELPENLIAKPSLVWLLDNSGTDHSVEATYLTGGIGWKADYVATLNKEETALDLEGWVTLNNQSGAAFTNAQVKLVAGGVNIVRDEAPMPKRLGRAGGVMEMGQMPVEEAFAEYHLYTLPRRTTIKENQSKQVSLLSAAGIGAKKLYEFVGNITFFSQRIAPMTEQKVSVFLEFQNKAENQLGVPLPGGVIRVYQADSEDMLQFSGEDRIEHTPKDEEVKIRLGEAFDVVGERIQTDFKILANNLFESAYEIKIRNHKEADITVDVIEPMTSDWRITEQSHEFVKKDAFTAVFSLPVPKDGETVLTYRVMVRH